MRFPRTYFLPSPLMSLFLFFIGAPPKISRELVEIVDEMLRKLETMHNITRDSLQNGFDNDFFSGRGEKIALPSFDFIPNTIPDEAKNFGFTSSEGKREAEILVVTLDYVDSESTSHQDSLVGVHRFPEANLEFSIINKLAGGPGIDVKACANFSSFFFRGPEKDQIVIGEEKMGDLETRVPEANAMNSSQRFRAAEKCGQAFRTYKIEESGKGVPLS